MSTSICKCDLDTVTLYYTVTVIMTTCRQLVNDFGLWTQIRVDMVECGDINMDDSMHKFCVSWFSIHVVNVGVVLLIKAWNNHTIPG